MGGNHRRVRPRYGRISALATSVAITAVAVLGGAGALPGGGPRGGDVAEGALASATDTSPVKTPEADPGAVPPAAREERRGRGPVLAPVDLAAYAAGLSFDTSLPLASGEGRRVVYSERRQRVWLVDDGEEVEHTYLVSGTVHDNLDPGTYEVFSRSANAVGIDDSGTMRWFVRFTRGPSGAAIGFHDIPVKDGVPLQSVAELGTPQSHGCIRQRRPDARRLWDFAPLGTTVVVTP